jgi:tRNA dimethylallyltransferase
MPCPAAWRGRGTTADGAPELPPLLVIGGATATGKTALAIELALRIGEAEIVSADSRQVYRGMDIGTAKATAQQRAAVIHHGLDLVDPDEPFTAADYRREALTALGGIAARGRVAVLVGGTGLYLRSVARGLPLDVTGADPQVRSELEARLVTEGLAVLADELRGRDPGTAARIDLHNPRRVVRALERVIVTGSAVPPAPRGYPGPMRWLAIAQDPTTHRAAIAARAHGQFAGGLLEEARILRARYPDVLPAFSAMGYREAFDVIAGRTDVTAAVAADTARTWAYARRQRTWFRAEAEIGWLAAGEGLLERAWSAIRAWRRAASGYAGRR